ncbi:MAG: aldehyde dehydrogenase family protein [Pseudomonadota bacterium]
MSRFKCLSPIDGDVVFDGALADQSTVDAAVLMSMDAQVGWAEMALDQRVSILHKAIEHLHAHRQEIGLEITRQMGRPIRFSPNELDGLKQRGDAMLSFATTALEPHHFDDPDATKWIERQPLGLIAVLAPWNYPFLTSVNAIIPALAAGNSVILKHSCQTPLAATRYAEAFQAAGLPEGVFQHLFMDHETTAALVASNHVDYVAFTGSTNGGRAISAATAGRFIDIGLELGGKDPAYVRHDADIQLTAEAIADGAFFNSGQSCCGIERAYVEKTIFDQFCKALVERANALTLGDPRDPDTTLGPMVNAKAADFVRSQIKASVNSGATAHLALDENAGSAFLSPQVLTGVSHEMSIMREETFGPALGVMPVDGDKDALALMNDSDFGLTASIWTKDNDAARSLASKVAAGTVFMNRCDYLDPSLAWTGVKKSGCGWTLSPLGFDRLTRPKSYYFQSL